MPDPITLLDLPHHVLVNALARVGDVASAVNVGRTCRDLRRLMTDVWRELFLLNYDDPRRAAAFLVPRNKFDWKQRFLDRDSTIRFLSQRWPRFRLDKSNGEGKQLLVSKQHYIELMCEARWAPHVCRTVLDLYRDLPPVGEVSLNLPVLVSLVVPGKTLAFMCRTSDIADVNHLEALFNCLPSFRRKLHRYDTHDTFQDRRFLGWKGVDPNFVDARFRFWGSYTPNWAHAATASVCLDPCMSRWQTPGMYTEGFEDEEAIVLIESRRGQAMSVLKLGRPCNLLSDDIWDWAGVSGTWHGIFTIPPLPYNRFSPVHFSSNSVREGISLSVVAGRSEVLRAYSTLFPETNTHALWDDFDDLDNLDSDANGSHPLQPLLFHGACRTYKTHIFVLYDQVRKWGRMTQLGSAATPSLNSAPQAFPEPVPLDHRTFIHGVVRLANDPDSDSPPQVRYTIVFTHWSGRRVVLRAVQPWGPGSAAGLLGAYTHPGFGYDPVCPVGFMWLWKPPQNSSSPRP